jgi:hypothetical protein
MGNQSIFSIHSKTNQPRSLLSRLGQMKQLRWKAKTVDRQLSKVLGCLLGAKGDQNNNNNDNNN